MQQQSVTGTSFAYEITLTRPDNIDCQVQVALAFVTIDATECAHWTSDDFFVPPSLWGAGIGGRFLTALLKYLPQLGVRTCKVCVGMPTHRSDDTARINRVNFVEFYKRHGFRLDAPRNGATDEQVDLTLRLPA